MIKKSKIILITFCSFVFGIAIRAQQTVSTTGGDAADNGGMISYTVGQVAYITTIDDNVAITQGIQQPYEILILNGFEEAKNIIVECIVFPNPTKEFLKLKIENYKSKNLSYQIYDMNGKLLESKKVEGNETIISMENFIPSSYFLNITDNNKELKTFKIIKY